MRSIKFRSNLVALVVLAVLALMGVTLPLCFSGHATAQSASITSVNPTSGAQGQTMNVAIVGTDTNFVNGTSVASFGSGIAVNTTTVSNATHASANITILPTAAPGTRDVNVTTGGETPDPLTGGFTVSTYKPTIDKVVPGSGPPGALVTITGFNFGSSRESSIKATAASYVSFNGVVASEYQAWSDTAIIVKVPLGASSGNLVVTTAEGDSNGEQFTIGPAYSYYFAEGTTRPNFQEWLCLMNPNVDKAKVHVTYMMGDGTTQGQDISVPQLSRATVYVPDVIGLSKDVSTRVDSDKPIVAERPMYFNYLPVYAPGQQWNGGHDVIGALAPGAEWYFAEGTTRPGFEEWICLQNPTTATAHVQILYMLGTGQTMTQGIDVGPTTRKTIDVRAAIGANVDCSAKVTSDVGIIAERPMYFNYMGDANDNWTGGHDVVGANRPWTNWYFAEGTTRPGFDEWVCLQNPSDSAAYVTILYSLANGENPSQVVTVPAHSRQTISVPGFLGRGKDVSMHIVSATPIVAERPMYFNYGPGQQNWNGGHDVIGSNGTAKTCEFAEGATWGGFQEYLSIQNPNSTDISVTINYMLGTGANAMQTVPVKAMSRVTVDVNAFIGPNQDVSARVTCNDPIVVERPMYFSYQGSGTRLNWTGGHDVIGLSY